MRIRSEDEKYYKRQELPIIPTQKHPINITKYHPALKNTQR